MYKMYHENSCQLIGSKNIQTYVTGGKGVVTLKSPTGVHHSYSFRKPRDDNKFIPNTLFVYVLAGEHRWLYAGMVTGRLFKLTQSSRFLYDSPQARGVRYILRMMYDDKLQTPMQLFHEGVCSICGRPLTSPKSIELGIGPRCRGDI